MDCALQSLLCISTIYDMLRGVGVYRPVERRKGKWRLMFEVRCSDGRVIRARGFFHERGYQHARMDHLDIDTASLPRDCILAMLPVKRGITLECSEARGCVELSLRGFGIIASVCAVDTRLCCINTKSYAMITRQGALYLSNIRPCLSPQ